MRKILLNLAGLGFLAFLSSCGGDDPLPAPNAGFLQDKTYIEIGESITFSSTSTSATIFSWNFGNGQTSEEQSPTITFNEEGEFNVTLTAFTEDDQSDSASATVFVGERVVVAISVGSINFLKPDNMLWDDDGTGPDVFMAYGEVDAISDVSNPNFAFFGIAPDLTASELPLAGELPSELQLKFSDQDWFLQLDDNDTDPNADPSDPNSIQLETMAVIGPFNPLEFGFTNNDDGTGFLLLEVGGFSINLFYEIVVDLND